MPLEFGKRDCEKLFPSFFRHKPTLTTTIDHAVPFFEYLPFTLIASVRKEVPGGLAPLFLLCSEEASMQIMIRNRNSDIIQQQKGLALCLIFIAWYTILLKNLST